MGWKILIAVFCLVMNSHAQTPVKQETIELGKIQTYYEVYGNGPPLFLLHGFTQSSKFWLPVVDTFSHRYSVYVVDLLGHGKSSPFVEPLSIRTAAENLNNLIEYLDLNSIKAIGYSYGAEILCQLALINPSSLQGMIMVGSCGSWEASEFPEFVQYLSYDNIDQLTWMPEQQLNDDRIRNILAQFPNYSVSLEASDLERITCKTFLMVGDRDPAVPMECVARAHKYMPDSYLWVIPNLGHSLIYGQHHTTFVEKANEFFNDL